MADVTGLVVGATTVGANYNKFAINTSDAGRELIISLTKTDMTDADVLAVYRQLTLTGGDGTGADVGGPDAGTWAGFGTADGTAFVSGTTDAAFIRLQTTGTPDTTTVAGVTLAIVATFVAAR